MPSPTYQQLHKTAVEFIHSTDRDAQTGGMDRSRLEAVRTADYRHRWGHAYFTTHIQPGLGREADRDGFVAHLEAMTPTLASWDCSIGSVVVDVEARTAAVRVRYLMAPRGAAEVVENEVVWLLEFGDDGDKVRAATEFIDGYAAARQRELTEAAQRA